MSGVYWEDRLSSEQFDKINVILKGATRRKLKKSRTFQDEVYDGLTNNGMTSEEADEMINTIIENGD